MSLISLSSKSVSRNDTTQQAPFNFKNFFPQPIVIKPKSQVCLTTFYHFRTEGVYNINPNNDLIGYCFGDRQYNNVMYASLTHGNYEGADLATEVARAMNSANVQQNYEWTCTFQEGNVVANPPTQDEFTIEYQNIATPLSKGGTWSLFTSRNQDALLDNKDTEGSKSELTNESDKPLPIKLKDGLLVHEGYVRYENIGNTHNHASLEDDGELTPVNMGFISSAMAVDSGNMAEATTFNSDFGEILVQTGGTEIQISTLQQIKGTKSINLPNNRGKKQTYRRVMPEAFIDNILGNTSDRLAIEIHRVSSLRVWVVKIQVSTDGGTTYVDVDDGKGTNADGTPNVYSQTIGGVAFTSLIYSTAGISNGSGGFVQNPVNNESTRTANSATNRKAPFIPFFEVMERAEHITGLDLTGDTFTLSIVPAQGTPSLIADNVFQMNWQADTSGNGFLWGMFENTAPTTPSAQISSTNMADWVIGNPLISEGTFLFDVFADNTLPINSSVKIAEMTYDPDSGGNGSWELSGIDGATGITLDPVAFDQDTAKPDIETDDAVFKLDGVFNPENNPITLSTGEFVAENSTIGRSHEEPEDETLFTDLLTDTQLGVDLAQESFLILARANQDTLAKFPNAPVKANGAKDPNIPPLQRFGTAFKVLGFNESIIVNDASTFQFVSDTKPFLQMDETSIHISIPELTGVMSYEGEAENTSKTIKVIPKNEFTNSSTSEAMTFTSPYEEWIDINNAEPLVLNEMTLQVRRPDGRMATNLKPITRATIKIQEDPEVKKLQAQREMIEALASTKAQAQNTGRVNFMDASSWVGS